MSERERRSDVLRLSARSSADRTRLLDALSDPAWRVRAAAVDVLASGDPAAVVPELAWLMSGPGGAAARDAAAHALVLIGEHAVEPVAALLEHAEASVRKVALDVLGRVGASRVVTAVAARLEDPDANVRAAAAEALGGMPGEVASEALRRALQGDERLVRAHALEALERLGGEAPLAAMLAAYEDPLLRRRALPLLARRDEAEAHEAVVAALGDPARSVRLAALGSLFELYGRASTARRARLRALVTALPAVAVAEGLEGPEHGPAQGALLVIAVRREAGAAPLVARAADRPELRASADDVLRGFGPEVAAGLREVYPGLGPGGRAAVLRVLERCEDAADHALLRAAAAGADPELVRAAAIRALGRVPGAAPDLLALLDEADLGIAATAADALVRLCAREPGEVRAAVRAAPDTPGTLRLLGRVGEAGDRERLHAALENPALRAAALEGLSRLRDPGAGTALIRALGDPSPEVRVAAAHGLGASPGGRSGVIAALTAALRDPAVPVAAAAAEALGDLHAAPEALREALRAALPRGGAHALLAIACVRGLGATGHDEGIAAAFDSLDPEVVKAAAAAAGPGCARELVAALAHPGWDVRRAAAAGLRRNRVRSARAAVAAALERERDGLVVAALRSALSELEEEDRG